jgi:nucleotide-binding universal stress UspA family protein
MSVQEEAGAVYKRILLPLDGSAMAEQALPHALAVASHFGAELILLRILEPFPHIRGISATELAAIREQTEEWAHAYFGRITAELEGQPVPILTAMIEGRPSVAIMQFAENNAIDLIVICSRGRSGLSRWLMGGVADRVVRGATVPVLLVQARGAKSEEP